ncbi:WD domain, G-beta repeat [Plasmodiophora brassicae]
MSQPGALQSRAAAVPGPPTKPEPGEGSASAAAIELEHGIGYTSTARNGIVLHPNGRDYVSAVGACIVINDLNDPHRQAFLRGHTQTVTCVDVSGSGRLIASGQLGAESDVIVWDFDTKSIRYRFEEHQSGIAAVCFSWDERFLVTVGAAVEGKLIVWDCRTGLIVGSALTAPSPFCAIAWGGRIKDVKRRPTSDCQFATCAEQEGPILMWKLTPSTGHLSYEKACYACRPVRHSPKQHSRALCFSPDGDFLFAGSTSGDVLSFLVRNGGLCATIPACAGGVHALIVTPECDAIVGGGDGSIVCFRRENPRSYVDTKRVRLPGGVSSLSNSADWCEVVVGTLVGDAYRLRLSDLNDKAQARVPSSNHSAPVNAIAFPPGVSDRFASCASDGTVKMWDVSDYTLISSGRCESHAATSLAVSEECIITGWDDGKIRSMEAATGDQLWAIANAHTMGVSALALSPNEKFIVSGGVDGDVRVWEIRNRDLLCRLKEHTSRVNSLAIYADNRCALSCSRDRSILCWDLQAELRVSCHRQNMGGINDIGVTRDQTLVVSVGQEKRVTFWDLRQPQAVQTLELGAEGTYIDVSPNGTMFATGDDHCLVKLFDMRTRSPLATGVGHSKSLSSVRFSPDGKQVISAGDDGSILIWNIFTT